MKNIGVLSYQGAGHLFIIALIALGYRAHKIFFYSNLTNLDGIILPGGESSVQYDYCVDNLLDKKIYEFYKSKKPILGTCAGAILLSMHCSQRVKGFRLIDIDVQRNIYGQQIHSQLIKTDLGSEFLMIRAPGITKYSKKVKVLDTLNKNPIFVKQENVYCTTFHPELASFNKDNLITKIF